MNRIVAFCLFFTAVVITGCDVNQQPDLLIGFQQQKSNSNASFRGISAVNDSVCWISGSNGTVMRTLNGGKSWEKHTVPGHNNADFRDNQAFSSEKAIIMAIGSPAKIFRTNNGGKSWWLTYFYDHPDAFLDGMAFWNEKEGIAFGDQIDGRIFIIKTDNGGNSWYPIEEENMPAALDGEGGFAGSGTGIYVGSDSLAWIGLGFPRGRVLYSTNKGLTWDFQLTGLGNGDSSRGVYSIDISHKNEMIAVGGSWNKPVAEDLTVVTSSNRGAAWNMVEENTPKGYRSCVAFIPGTSSAVCTGTTGTDISFDAGNSWENIDPNAFNSLAWSPSGKVGWIVGNEGEVARLIVSKPVKQ